jgi:hypothetical protein
MGKGNGFVQQALSLVTAAATLLPGMPAVAGAAEKAEALKCFNNTTGTLSANLKMVHQNNVLFAVACVTKTYGLGSRDPEFLDFATEASRRGFPVDSAVPRYRNMQLSGSASYSGSGGGQACPRGNTGDPKTDDMLRESCLLQAQGMAVIAANGVTYSLACIEGINKRNQQAAANRPVRNIITLVGLGLGGYGLIKKDDTAAWAGGGLLAANLLTTQGRQAFSQCEVDARSLRNTLNILR